MTYQADIRIELETDTLSEAREAVEHFIIEGRASNEYDHLPVPEVRMNGGISKI